MERIAPRAYSQHTPPPEQLALDLTMIEIRPKRIAERETICAASTEITIDGITLTAAEWAARRGLKWQTVKMRRMRGENWRTALTPALRRTSWISRWAPLLIATATAGLATSAQSHRFASRHCTV